MRHAILPLLATLAALASPGAAADLVVLRYGEVLPNPAAGQPATATAALIEHLELLTDRGYVPVSLGDVLAGGDALPERAVLFTFDGGYASFATEVAPLLEVARVPSVVGVATGWLDGDVPPPDDRPRLTWADLRRLTASPSLVAVASHGHDLWRELPATSFGDTGPAATTRDFATAESDEARRQRLARDLDRSAARFAAELGSPVRAIAWPWGAWDRHALEAARDAGFEVAMALRPRLDPGRERGDGVLRRIDMTHDVGAAGLEWALHPTPVHATTRRSIAVDLGWFGTDPDLVDDRLDTLMARLAPLGSTTLMLQLPRSSASSASAETVGRAAHVLSGLRARSEDGPILLDLRAAEAAAATADDLELLLGRIRVDGVVLPRPPADGQRTAALGALPDAVIVVPMDRPDGDTALPPEGVDVVLFAGPDPGTLIDRFDELSPGVAGAAFLTGNPDLHGERLAREIRRLSAAGWRWIGLDVPLSRALIEGPYQPASAEMSERRKPRDERAQ